MVLVVPEGLLRSRYRKPSGGNKTTPRSWSKEEAQWLVDKKAEGFSVDDIAEALGRSHESVEVKLKRVSKSNDSYNEKFRNLKYLANQSFVNEIKPQSALDVYAGNSWWKDNVESCISNDKDKSFDNDYHVDAFDLMCQMHLERRSFDVIDLDPFGSAYESFDIAFRMARKGVVISFGEWGHKRWKRLDFVRHRYGIESLEDFEADAFIREAQRIARLHKKQATVFDTLQYSNFLRVYFTISPFKETSQWQKS